MSKCQSHMLNDDVCRAMTDKQNKKNTTTYILSKDIGKLFLPPNLSIFYIPFSICLKVKKAVSKKISFLC